MEGTEATATQWRWPESEDNVIPREVFSRHDVYELELEKIFRGPTWHLVAHASELPEASGFKNTYCGDAPIIIVRGADGRIRTFLNACAHRGTMLETRQRGVARSFQCPYHRWTFDSTGKLIGCPGEEDFPASFRREDFGLHEIRTEEFLGLIFVTFDPRTEPLDEYLGDNKDAIRATLGGDGNLRLLGYQKSIYQCNWKLHADQDGYHPPLLHAAFRLLNWQGGKGEIAFDSRANMVLTYETTQYVDNGFLHDPSVVELKRPRNRARVIMLFPANFVADHLDTINMRFIRPMGPDRTEVHYAYFARYDDDPDYVRHRIRQSSNLLGPAGLVSFDDATVFIRTTRADGARVANTFLKGYREGQLPDKWAQNTEAPNIVRWRVYRQMMGL
jgi:anthranilate 1,2-dioxygenase large subunit